MLKTAVLIAGQPLSYVVWLRLILLVIEVETIHQGVYLAAFLLCRAACASFAEYKDGLTRRGQLVKLLLWRDVKAVCRHILRRLSRADKFHHLI